MSQTTSYPVQRDTLAEVLKALIVGNPISKEQAQAALDQHNKARESMANAKQVLTLLCFQIVQPSAEDI